MQTRSQSLVAAMAAAFSLSASSCSLIIDTDANQCKADADCAAFPGRVCQSGVCAGECKVNADCSAKGPHVICRKDTQRCVALTSPACATIYGDEADDNAFILGSVLPTTGLDSSSGT